MNYNRLNLVTKQLRNLNKVTSKDIDPFEEGLNLSKNKNEKNYGIPLHSFILNFDQVFHGFLLKKISDFITKCKDCNTWAMFSDYAFYNKDKKNDVVSFVVMPNIHGLGLPNLSRITNFLSPKDLKKNRKVNEKFIKFLENFPMISFNFVLNKDRFKNNPALIDNKYFKNIYNTQIKYMIFLTIVDFERYKDHNNRIKSYKEFIRLSEQKNTNKKVLFDLILIGQFAGYISGILSSIHKNISLFSWFSDRDAFLNINKSKLNNQIPYIFDIYANVDHQIKYFYKTPINEIGYGISEGELSTLLDKLLRIPDLLAGTIADWDLNKNTISHLKFKQIISNLIADSSNHFIIHLEFSLDDSIKLSIPEITRKFKF